jgi:uncharacterized membrane protein YtjA (UPF0391 family)
VLPGYCSRQRQHVGQRLNLCKCCEGRDLDANFAGDGCFHRVGSGFGPRGEQVFLQAVEGGMLKLVLFFFIISIIAGVFGFTGISAATAGIAKVLFFIFIIVFMVLLSSGLVVGSAIF